MLAKNITAFHCVAVLRLKAREVEIDRFAGSAFTASTRCSSRANQNINQDGSKSHEKTKLEHVAAEVKLDEA